MFVISRIILKDIQKLNIKNSGFLGFRNAELVWTRENTQQVPAVTRWDKSPGVSALLMKSALPGFFDFIKKECLG